MDPLPVLHRALSAVDPDRRGGIIRLGLRDKFASNRTLAIPIQAGLAEAASPSAHLLFDQPLGLDNLSEMASRRLEQMIVWYGTSSPLLGGLSDLEFETQDS